MTMLHVINNARFFFFCHSQIILINNLAFSLDCATLWLEMANGAFHTALSTKVTMWWFPVNFLTLTFITSKRRTQTFITSKQSAFGDLHKSRTTVDNFTQLSTLIISNPTNSTETKCQRNDSYLEISSPPLSLSLSLSFSIFLGGLKHVKGEEWKFFYIRIKNLNTLFGWMNFRRDGKCKKENGVEN